MAATTTLPRFIVIKPNDSKGFVYYKVDEGQDVGTGSVLLGEEESVFSTLVKIEVEPAATGKFVHLRFFHSNKYWARNAGDRFIVAQSNQPEEDVSQLFCTLFETHWVNGRDGVFYLTHVQSGGRQRIDDQSSGVYADQKSVAGDGYLSFVDWDTLVKLPEHVAFKGDNGKYLKLLGLGLPLLQFSSDDANEELSGHHVRLLPDGSVRIKSEPNQIGDFFWNRNGSNIWSTLVGDDMINSLFWPVKIDDNTIALRSSNFFCSRSTDDLLVASVSTMTKETRFEVQELVLERRIGNLARCLTWQAQPLFIYNDADVEASVAVQIIYQEERSYSFSRSLSLTAGVKTSIEVNLLDIVKGGIELSFEISGSFEWANTTTTTTSVTATGAVPVPPRTTAVVGYVGTKGTCSVPSPTLTKTGVPPTAMSVKLKRLMVFTMASIVTTSPLW